MKPNAVCDKRGKAFHRRPSQLAKSERAYCSTKCYGEAKINPDYECRQCGTPFRAKRKEQKFCSAECAARAATTNKPGEALNLRRSAVYKLSDQDFAEMVKSSSGITDIAMKCGLSHRGSNRKKIKCRILEMGLETDHFTRWGFDWMAKEENPPNRVPLSKAMVENSTFLSSSWLKARLFKEGILENKCVICGQEPVWNGNNLVLILDHINGIRRDNRRENLRIVCPHCDSQLDTYKSRNKGRNQQGEVTRMVRVLP